VFQVPTKTQYAIRALVHLVRAKSASVASIAEAQHIPYKYLEAIFGQLKNAGLLVSDRGRSGGYRLARAPESILMSEVVKVMEGDITPVTCLDDTSFCIVSETCLPRRFLVWLEAHRGCIPRVGDACRDCGARIFACSGTDGAA